MGVKHVGEAEPPHGDLDADLWGTWRGQDAIATVTPPHTPALDGQVTRTWIIDGVTVERVEVATRHYDFLRFAKDGDSWAVYVLTHNGQMTNQRASLNLARILLRG